MAGSEKWKRYYADPFGFFDNLDLRFRGINFNFFSRSRTVAKNLLVFALVMAGLWVVCGFDSSPGQLIHVLYQLPAFFLGHANMGDLVQTYVSFYGKEMHYSAFVIYGLMYWALSVHMDQGLIYSIRWWAFDRLGIVSQDLPTQPTGLGIQKSKNIVYSVCLTLLAGGAFELFWIFSFAYFQGQPWVATFQGPQLFILVQDLVFVVFGVLGVFYMWADSYLMTDAGVITGRRWRFNWSWWSWILVLLTVSAIFLWWFYPGQIRQVTVTLNNGQVWRSSPFFPQTLYTIELTPGTGAGSWFWIQDDVIHGLNTLVKVLLTLCFAWVGLLQKVDEHDKL
jgi:hypothetical protein